MHGLPASLPSDATTRKRTRRFASPRTLTCQLGAWCRAFRACATSHSRLESESSLATDAHAVDTRARGDAGNTKWTRPFSGKTKSTPPPPEKKNKLEKRVQRLVSKLVLGGRFWWWPFLVVVVSSCGVDECRGLRCCQPSRRQMVSNHVLTPLALLSGKADSAGSGALDMRVSL